MKDGGRGMRTGMVQRRQGAKGAPVENARRRPFTADGWSSASPLASTRHTHLVLDITKKKKTLFKKIATLLERTLVPSLLNKNCNFVSKEIYKQKIKYQISKWYLLRNNKKNSLMFVIKLYLNK